MNFQTISNWNEDVWDMVSVIYQQAFDKGAKPKHVIENMFKNELCHFHLAIDQSTLLAFALTSSFKKFPVLIIDYLAVKKDVRNHGIGSKLLDYISEWVQENSKISYIIIEVEAENTPSNTTRIKFWESNGYKLTDYIHQYKWVPEPYRAMYRTLSTVAMDEMELSDGEELFKHITFFHKQSFSKR